MILQAYGQLQFLSLQALQVAAKPPRPRHSSIFMIQLPIFLFFYFILILQSQKHTTYLNLNTRHQSVKAVMSSLILQIMTAHQQKINIKNTLKAQRKYLLPLNSKSPNENVNRHLQRTSKIENPSKYQKRQHESVITLNIFNDFFERLSNQKLRKNNCKQLPRICDKRSFSVNIDERGISKSINRVKQKRVRVAKVQTQLSLQSPWEELDSPSKITLIYQPLLGRRHTNTPFPVAHQAQAINTPTKIEQTNQGSVIYYKHPLHQKCIRKQDLITQPSLFTGKIRNQSYKIQRHWTKIQRLKNNRRRFNKVCNAIIFIQYLRRYNRMYRAFRQRFMFELTIQRIKQQISKFRQCLWIQLNEFSALLFEKRHVNFIITERDSEVLCEKKMNYLNTFLVSLSSSIQMAFRQLHSTKLMELIYHLCKHGCYGIGENLLTEEQLDLTSLSETQGYIRCDQNLQKSSIISLLFIKIVLYSTVLKPHTMTYKFSLGDNEYFQSNIKLVGNILYRIIIQMQKIFIKNASKTFQIGNWRKLRGKFIVKTTKSLTMKQGVHQKQLISGLISEKTIRQAYSNPDWNQIQIIVYRTIDSIHEKIKQFHQKCRKTCF